MRAARRVQIIAASFSHIRAKRAEFDGAVLEEQMESIDWRWIVTPGYKGNGVGRVKNQGLKTYFMRIGLTL